MEVTLAKPVDPAQLPDDASVLKAVISQLLESLGSLRRQNQQLGHRLQQLLRARFGPKAEKIDPAQMALFVQEILAEAQPTPQPPAEDQSQAQPKAKGHGRRKPPRELPRKRVVLDVPPQERTCKCCGQEMTRIGEETSEQIDFHPASVYVIETVQPKYACKHCPDGGVVTAEKPRQPIEKGLPGPGMLAQVIVSKYADHLPLNRLEGIFQRYGRVIRRSTMCDWMASSAALLHPLYDLMIERLLCSGSLHTDDTPVAVLDRLLDKTRQGRLWAYIGDDLHPYTVYDYTPNRKRDGPVKFLGDYEGYLHADAYAGYDGIFATDKVVEVLCWAHYPESGFIRSKARQVAPRLGDPWASTRDNAAHRDSRNRSRFGRNGRFADLLSVRPDRFQKASRTSRFMARFVAT